MENKFFQEMNVPDYYGFAALYFFGEGGVGRRKLSKELGISESKTRTMIEHLQDRNIIESDNVTKLSEKGLEIYNQKHKRVKAIKELEPNKLTVAEKSIGALVMGGESKVGKGLELRDEAVRAGAKGLTVLKYDEKFSFPDKDNSNGMYQEEMEKIEEKFNTAWEGDILLISSAEDLETAKAGLWSSLQELLK